MAAPRPEINRGHRRQSAARLAESRAGQGLRRARLLGIAALMALARELTCWKYERLTIICYMTDFMLIFAL